MKQKKIIVIGLIVNLIIAYNTIIYASAYADPENVTIPQKPIENPSISDIYDDEDEETKEPSSGYLAPTPEPSPYLGPYGSDTGNIPTNPATSNSPTGALGNSTASTTHTPDEIINEANGFVSQGTTSPIDGEKLKSASSTLYNLLLSIGIFLSVAIGVYLGVKFMLSTAEDKAKVKEALIPYIVGCIVIFSAFIIWKAVILLLGGIS